MSTLTLNNPLLSIEDVPTFLEQGAKGSGVGYFRYRGNLIPSEQFKAQYPSQYAAWQKNTGGANGSGAIPAGQPGSPYPSSLPPTSFDAALNLALQEREKGIAQNEKRYSQLISNTGKRIKLVDDSFAGIRDSIAKDNQATDAEMQGVYSKLASGYQSARQDIEQIGGLALSEAERRAASSSARADADARSRGLYSSTVVDAGRRRANEDLGREKRGIYESIAGLRSGLTERETGALAQFGTQRAQVNQAGRLRDVEAQGQKMQGTYQALADRAGVIERRLDTYPSAAEIAQIIAEREGAQAQIKAQKRNSTAGTIGAVLGGIGGIFSGLCDKRIKINVRKMGDSSILPGCGVYYFEYLPEVEKALNMEPGFSRVGWIAQEVRAVRPDWVRDAGTVAGVEHCLMLTAEAVQRGMEAGEMDSQRLAAETE